jgi:threonine dehydrogenase-like Zn-dependent dehydrogenase
MRAVVMRDQQLVVTEVADPVPSAGQVLVKTLACGICGSDLHFLKHGHRMVELSKEGGAFRSLDLGRDLVMGHEFVAEVLETRPDSFSNAQVGDLVVSMPVLFGSIPPTIETTSGIGYSNDVPGGYGERMVLSGPMLLKVPNGLDIESAALTEPMAVGLHAVNKSRIVDTETAIVHGCGPVGLAVIAALKLKGIRTIVASDFSPARRALAVIMGATEVIDPAQELPFDAWARVTSWKGPQLGVEAGLVQFECIGVPGILQELMKRSPKNTRITVVGVCMEADTIQPIFGINKELQLQFVLGYTPDEFAETLGHIAEGRLPVTPLITGRVGLDGVAQAFQDLGNPELHAKVLVKP